MEFGLPLHLKSLLFRSSTDKQNWQNIDYFEVLSRKQFNPSQQLSVKLHLKNEFDKYIRTIFTTADNQRISFDIKLENTPQKNVSCNIINVGKFLVLKFSDISPEPGIQVGLLSDKDSCYYHPGVLNNRIEQLVPADKFKGKPTKILLSGQSGVLFDTTLVYYSLPPDQSQIIHIDKYLTLETSPQSTYDTLLISLQKSPVKPDLVNIVRSQNMFTILPHDQPLKKSVRLELAPDSLPSKIPGLGIYRLSKNNRLEFLGKEISQNNLAVSTRISRFGTFLLAQDTIPPDINIEMPGANQSIKRLKKIRFIAKDSLSGIASEKAFSLMVDGKFILPEWDPEEDIIEAVPHFQISTGKHLLQITVEDATGNIRSETIPFNIIN